MKNKINLSPLTAFTLLLIAFLSQIVMAGEIEIGKPVEKNGMNIGAIYLQAVMMEPMKPMEKGHYGDIHLEADVAAMKDNPYGFEEGAWIPYLDISYHITKKKSQWSSTGSLRPMVANDGPHYGDNIKLDGPGSYHVVYHFNPPVVHGFQRHIDKETGVNKWWTPFNLEWDFTYIGIGKKGGY
jgi:uncharacterized protein involved in high-affinity Fe2+ transport